MPFFQTRPINYGTVKEAKVLWDQFRGGLNTLLAPTEIADNELVKMDNVLLVGKGIPKKRGGTDNYFLTAASVATGSQRVRGLKSVLFASGTSGVNELLALSDSGFLVKRSNASYSIIPGYSYASGYNAEMVQAYNNVFIVNGNNALTKYNGVTISPYTALIGPTSVTATNVSGISGTYAYSYRVSATNDVGETLASSRVSIGNLPRDLTSTVVWVQWATASPTSNVNTYQIYGREAGDEVLLFTIPSSSLRFEDSQYIIPKQLALPPLADTTGGPVAKYVISHKDKVVLANITAAQSRVMWSGGGPVNIDKFHWSQGGGYIDIDRDSGEVITGLIDAFDAIIVFKTRSVWRITLSFDNGLGVVVPNLSLITRHIGCVSPKSIKAVENDLFFLTRKGIYTLGREPNITAPELRTNEVSAKVRPFFQDISERSYEDVSAIYHDNKYRITRPDGEEVLFDRERVSWAGPNTFPASPAIYEIYYDGDNVEHLLWGDMDDTFVTEYSTNFSTDKGTNFPSRLLTKKEYFDLPYRLKDFRDVFTNWRNVSGTVNTDILVEGRDGNTIVAKSFSFTQAGSQFGVGFGFDKFGTGRFGSSNGAGQAGGSGDLVKWVNLNQIGRAIQLDINTSDSSTYELLSIGENVRPVGKGLTPSDWLV